MSDNNPTAQLKDEITSAINGYKAFSKKLPALLAKSARHYWDNSHSPDVLNHFLTALSEFPRLHYAALQAVKTFGKFDIDENTGTVKNKRHPDNKELVYKYTLDEKDKYRANISAYEDAEFKSLLHFIKDKRATKKKDFIWTDKKSNAIKNIRLLLINAGLSNETFSGSKELDLLIQDLQTLSKTIDNDIESERKENTAK
ncbi:hypothetical protein PXY30_004444 [Salmonella enterica]|nr:hypothetical protein [Salmonella enterica]